MARPRGVDVHGAPQGSLGRGIPCVRSRQGACVIIRVSRTSGYWPRPGRRALWSATASGSMHSTRIQRFVVLDRVYLFVCSYSLSCFSWGGPTELNTGSTTSPEIQEWFNCAPGWFPRLLPWFTDWIAFLLTRLNLCTCMPFGLTRHLAMSAIRVEMHLSGPSLPAINGARETRGRTDRSQSSSRPTSLSSRYLPCPNLTL
jgi:hypothetical protein